MLSYPAFWRRFTLRHARREWLQTLLMLLILGLGVGTFLSIRMANRAAVQGFQLFTESLNGTSDWIIEAPGDGIPVSDLPRIREVLGDLPADLFPVLEHNLTPVPEDGALAGPVPRPVRLLGLDLVQIRSVTGTGGDGDMEAFWSIIDDPEHLLVSSGVAGRWSLEDGDSVRLILQGRETDFTIRGILPEFRGDTPLPKNLAVADLGTLLARLPDPAIDRVEVIIPPGERREAVIAAAGEALRTAFAGEWTITSPAREAAEGATMTAAFRLNLTVLSLIALLVGMYLIAQTLDATVSRRRREIATLRSLGISPRRIFRLWLSEALIYGIAAGIAGLVIGYAMAMVTVEAVTTTVRALYRDTVQTAAVIQPPDVLLAFALGLGGSLIAAWLPARDAAGTPPAQFLRLGKRIPPFPIFQHPWIGAAALLVGAVLLLLPPWQPRPGAQIPVAGYATAFLWLTGGTLVTTAALKGIGRLFHSLSRNNPALRLAGSRLAQPTSRHQLALSGFFVAIGMAAAMAFLIGSFEHTVTGWLQQRLRADLFISSVGFQGSDTIERMPDALLDAIEADQDVLEMDRFRFVEADVGALPTGLAGIRFDLLGDKQSLLWLNGPRGPDAMPVDADAPAYANENLSRRGGLGIGDVVEISTPAGAKRLWIAGIHADYGRDNGLLFLDLPVLESWYPISAYETASLFLKPGADPATVQARLRQAYPGLAIRQNGELKETALFIFNQTFAVTYALQLIGLVVALSGLALSLLSLLRESGHELSLQRTLGMSRREIAATTAIEGMGIALAGLVSGLILSVALGYVLIFVVNRQSFGWTLQVAYPWRDIALLGSGVILLGAAISYATGWSYLRKWKREPF